MVNGGSYPWLYTHLSYWTMTRSTYSASNHLWGIFSNGGFVESFRDRDPYGVRPVISLNSEVELSEGNGTSTNPYKVSLQ